MVIFLDPHGDKASKTEVLASQDQGVMKTLHVLMNSARKESSRKGWLLKDKGFETKY